MARPSTSFALAAALAVLLLAAHTANARPVARKAQQDFEIELPPGWTPGIPRPLDCASQPPPAGWHVVQATACEGFKQPQIADIVFMAWGNTIEEMADACKSAGAAGFDEQGLCITNTCVGTGADATKCVFRPN